MKQLNLGELICELEKCNPRAPVEYDFGGFIPDGFDSYRGYYDHLALGFKEQVDLEDVIVRDLLAEAKKAIGQTFDGYKGGKYQMDPQTPLWVANYGKAPSTAIVGITNYEYYVIIETGHIK